MDETLNYYNENASDYINKTINGDMSEQIKRFIVLLPDKAHILDFGCGSGRDSKYFIEHGYTVTATDGSNEMCKLASKYIGQDVKCMKFDELNDKEVYDGIWACSSILHVKREELPGILKKMIDAIKEGGIIYTCFKDGDKEIIEGNRYYNYITEEILENMLKQVSPDTKIIEVTSNDTVANVNRPKVRWKNYLIRKKGK